jgi:hypothetical protein
MFASQGQEGTLPAISERREILEHAGLVVAQARALCEVLDGNEIGRIGTASAESCDIRVATMEPATKVPLEVTLQV